MNMVHVHLLRAAVLWSSFMLTIISAFVSERPASLLHFSTFSSSSGTATTSRVAISASSSFGDSSSPGQVGKNIMTDLDLLALAAANATSAFLYDGDADDSIQQQEEEEEEAEFERKRTQRANLLAGRRTYSVQLDLVNTNYNTIGLSLVQVQSGRKLRPAELDLDTTTTIQQETTAASTTTNEDEDILEGVTRPARQRMDWAQMVVEDEFQGLLVSSVIVSSESQAYTAGIRPGDVLTSATFSLGGATTSMTTTGLSLEQVADAWQKCRDDLNQKNTDSSMTDSKSNNRQGIVTLEFQRTPPTIATVQGGVQQENQFELTLQRPLGIEIQEDAKTGFVQVTGFTKNAGNLVRHAIQIGDRVVAVDSSLGSTAVGIMGMSGQKNKNLKNKMWPVSTVEGVISACTSRLPGQPVTLRFERPIENINRNMNDDGSSSSGSSRSVSGRVNSELAAAVGFVKNTVTSSATASTTTSTSATVKVKVQEGDKIALLKRCRTVLQRYATISTTTKPDKAAPMSMSVSLSPTSRQAASGVSATSSAAARFQDKYAVAAMVADKVVDALASARVALDSVTLSMIMKAYLSCRQPQDALRVFEAAVGFRADASARPLTETLIGRNGGGIIPTESALNLYTGTALLQAHAMLGDVHSVSRVMHALQGQSGVVVGGLESAPWPFTGRYGAIQPDTQCYNIAIAAAEKVGGEEALEMALELFRDMSDGGASKQQVQGAVQKNVVTFNTMISLLCNAGQWDKAFALFSKMKRLGVRPDKFTYTALVKACASDDDLQELLYDMQEINVKGDVVTYNTIIKALCDDRKWTKATKLVTEMELRGIAPDSMTYGFLMNAMLKADKPTACLTLFESACSNERTAPLMENVYLYTTAITAASVLGNHERALELVSRMSAQGVKPNMKTLTAVMGACLSANRPDLAAKVFQQMLRNAPSSASMSSSSSSSSPSSALSPDGLAVSKGIEALCGSGDIVSALTILNQEPRRRRKDDSRFMTGKQVMMAYQTVIVTALSRLDFDLAKTGLSDMLERGYIPNKQLLLSMLEAVGYRNEKKGHGTYFLVPSPSSSAPNGAEADDSAGVRVFRFLLFCLDALQGRKLPIEGSLYLAILTMGHQLGGCSRKLGSFLVESKTKAAGNNGAGAQLLSSTSSGTVQGSDGDDEEDCEAFPGWEGLFLNHYPSNGNSNNDNNDEDWYCRPPPVSVRLEPRELRRMLLAEQRVSSSSSSSSSSRTNRIRVEPSMSSSSATTTAKTR